MSENVINVQITGTTAAWLTKAAEVSGWSLSEVIATVFEVGQDADRQALLHQNAVPAVNNNVSVRVPGEFKPGDYVVDLDDDLCRVVETRVHEGKPTLRLALGWVESEDDPNKLDDIEELFDASAAKVKLAVLI